MKRTPKPSTSTEDSRAHREAAAAEATLQRRRGAVAEKRRRIEDRGHAAVPDVDPVFAFNAAMVAVLAHGSSDERLAALRLIRRHLSGAVAPGTREGAYLSPGFVPALLRILDPTASSNWRSSNDEMLEALWILTNAAASNDPAVVRAVLPTASLLTLFLSSSAWQLAECAAWALGNLAAEGEDSAATVIASGAVDPLVALLQSRGPGSHVTPATAAWALGNIVTQCVVKGSAAAARANAVSTAVDALSSLMRPTLGATPADYSASTANIASELLWLLHALVAADIARFVELDSAAHVSRREARSVPVSNAVFIASALIPTVLDWWNSATFVAANSHTSASVAAIIAPSIRILANVCGGGGSTNTAKQQRGNDPHACLSEVAPIVDALLSWEARCSVDSSGTESEDARSTRGSLQGLQYSSQDTGTQHGQQRSSQVTGTQHGQQQQQQSFVSLVYSLLDICRDSHPWLVREALWCLSNVIAVRPDSLLLPLKSTSTSLGLFHSSPSSVTPTSAVQPPITLLDAVLSLMLNGGVNSSLVAPPHDRTVGGPFETFRIGVAAGQVFAVALRSTARVGKAGSSDSDFALLYALSAAAPRVQEVLLVWLQAQSLDPCTVALQLLGCVAWHLLFHANTQASHEIESGDAHFLPFPPESSSSQSSTPGPAHSGMTPSGALSMLAALLRSSDVIESIRLCASRVSALQRQRTGFTDSTMHTGTSNNTGSRLGIESVSGSGSATESAIFSASDFDAASSKDIVKQAHVIVAAFEGAAFTHALLRL